MTSFSEAEDLAVKTMGKQNRSRDALSNGWRLILVVYGCDICVDKFVDVVCIMSSLSCWQISKIRKEPGICALAIWVNSLERRYETLVRDITNKILVQINFTIHFGISPWQRPLRLMHVYTVKTAHAQIAWLAPLILLMPSFWILKPFRKSRQFAIHYDFTTSI